MKKRKIKWVNVFIFLFALICVIGLLYSIYNIIKWNIDSNNTSKQIITVQEETKVKEIVDNDETEIIEQDEIDEYDPYWDYIRMNLIDVNFDELKRINNHVKGWIQVNGTNINYPFVQTSDNSYYLTHSFDKSYNGAGWVFMDYRNNIANNDRNTIIYAHGRADEIMFGSLKNILSSGWLNNKDNYIVKLSTEYENTLWQVFSVYRIPTTSDYIQTSFNNDDNYLQFINMIKERSSYNFNTSININDRVLTLSTCYNDNDKVVLHAKLIKREVR